MSIYYNGTKAKMEQHNITLSTGMMDHMLAEYGLSKSGSYMVRDVINRYFSLVSHTYGDDTNVNCVRYYESLVYPYIPANYDNVMSVNLPAEVWHKIDAMASALTFSRSAVIRDIIHYVLKYNANKRFEKCREYVSERMKEGASN